MSFVSDDELEQPESVLLDDEKSIHDLELQAVTFLEDGIQYRSILHISDPKSLYWYRLYRSSIVQHFFTVIIFFYLSLIFFEEPSSISWSSDPGSKYSDPVFEIHHVASHAIEAAILLILSVDVFCEIYFFRSYMTRRNPWIIAHVVIVLYSFGELIYDINVDDEDSANLIFRKIFRPFFMIRRSALIKKMLKSLVRSITEVVSILIMLGLNLIVFTLFALFLFGTENASGGTNKHHKDETQSLVTEGSQYFPDLFTGIDSLLVLLTTANNPTVTMPAYTENRIYALFFITYLCLGLYCLMNLLTAVIYNNFTQFFEGSVKSSLLRRRAGFRAAFCCLQELEMEGVCSPVMQSPGFLPHEVKVYGATVKSCISKTRFMDTKRKKKMCRALDRSTTRMFDYDRFENLLINFMESPKEREHKPPIYYVTNPHLLQLQNFLISEKSTLLNHVFNSANVIIIITCIAYSVFKETNEKLYRALLGFNIFFIVQYTAHACLELWAYGVKRYFSSRSRAYEFALTILIVIAGLSAFSFYLRHEHKEYAAIMKLMSALIVIKFMGFMAYIQKMGLVLQTLVDLITNLQPFAAIVVSAYYSFGVLGIILFKGVIKRDEGLNYTSLLGGSNGSSVFPVIQLPCGTYEQMNYWPTNFNDFFSACVLLWDIMVVNNWNVFLDVYSRVSTLGKVSQIYFVAWWLTSNVFLVNLLISLIIETFMLRLRLTNENKSESEKIKEEDDEEDDEGYRMNVPDVRITSPGSIAQSNSINSDQYTYTNSVNVEENLTNSTRVKFRYVSIYEIFQHCKQLAEPKRERVLKVLRKHPNKDFYTLPPPDYGNGTRLPAMTNSNSNFGPSLSYNP